MNNKKVAKYFIIVVAVLVTYAVSLRYFDSNAKAKAVKDVVKDATVIVGDVVDDAEIEILRASAAKIIEEEQDENPDYPEDYDPYNPIANGEFTEDDWAAIQYEEALNSLYNDIMHEQFDYKPDISDRVIKP